MVERKYCPRIDLSLRASSCDSSEEDERRAVSLHDIARALRTGLRTTDSAFDRFLPTKLQAVSPQYWTPLVVAARAAQWLERVGVQSVVDIGSGAGKFCVSAALASRCQYTGIEQRAHLVESASELARLFAVDDRVQFVHGTFGEMPLPVADAYYVFNPFEESFFSDGSALDSSVELSPARYARDLCAMAKLLEHARIGTYLLTYNGFGGSIPGIYQELFVDRTLPNVLRMWRKGSGTTAVPIRLAGPDFGSRDGFLKPESRSEESR